jgi:hypothetical protein
MNSLAEWGREAVWTVAGGFIIGVGAVLIIMVIKAVGSVIRELWEERNDG